MDQLSGSEKVVVGIDHAFLFPASYLNRYGLADWDTIATCLNMKRPLREQVTERLARLDIRVVGLHEQLDRIEQLLRARGSALEWSIAQESGYEEGCVRGDNRVQAEQGRPKVNGHARARERPGVFYKPVARKELRALLLAVARALWFETVKWGPPATVTVGSFGERNARELSDSLVNNPLPVNNRVPFGPRTTFRTRTG